MDDGEADAEDDSGFLFHSVNLAIVMEHLD